MKRYHTRRRILAASGLLSTGALAGCTVGHDPAETREPDREIDGAPAVPSVPQVDDPPDAVYIPTHREGMVHLPVVESGDYALSPMLTYPHAFWLVTGTQREEVVPADGHGVHLMVTLWDRETGQVLPVDAGAAMRVLKDGDVVDQRAPWPMISQTMGFHFGDNVSLPGDGTYEVEVDLNPIGTRKTGAFEGRFDEGVTASFAFEYDGEFRRTVVDRIEYLDEDLWGQRGALEPPDHDSHDDHNHDNHNHDNHNHDNHNHDNHNHDNHNHDNHNHDNHNHDNHMPFSSLPPAEEYPGRDFGIHSSGDADFVVRYLEDSRFADGGYLLVSPRTPYNRVPLADMALSVEGAVETSLVQTLDSEVGLHYGTAVALTAGDSFELVVESPPQVSRHAGYETAFVEMPPMEVEVPD